MKLYTLPTPYHPLLDLKQTELAIKQIKEIFQLNLSSTLRLRRVTAPLFVLQGTGLNDDLTGHENAVSFPIQDMNGAVAEVVHSLAKWKRVTLADYDIQDGRGIYTDMNAIRAHEELDNLHSLYVDQWDWERTIGEEDRTIKFLRGIVTRIYSAIRRTEFTISEHYPQLEPTLPKEIFFIHSEELRKRYPTLTAKEREEEITREHKAVFIIGIGGKLGDGEPHDNRAPDYDDYSTPNEEGYNGLNGDLLIWSDILGKSVELSSMGIRVDKKALLHQLKLSGKEERKELYFHRRLLNDTLPLSIGGGIGQSRLCMLLLKKAHIGEIQASIWPEEMREECRKMNIPLI
ncbi:MAG: aspartate--ammonia ligase [Bacteroidaceae bacterium]|nr:aspartate--ammonia ligase [Bacteroidaceae bacterium]